MKILIFITQFYRLGGAERLAVELAEELNKRNIHAGILSMYSEGLPGVVEAKQELLQRGIPNVYFLNMKINPSLFSMIPAILKLRHLIRKEQYDIVETSMLSPSVLTCWANLGLKTIHVGGIHYAFRREHENMWQHKFWRFSVQCNRQMRFYGISDYVAGHWTTYSSTPSEHTCRIYNGISDSYFDVIPERVQVRRELGIKADGKIAIYVGRLAKYKGIDTLLESLGPVLGKENIYLLYAGEIDRNVNGTTEIIQSMKKKITEKGWSQRVLFLGYRHDIPRLMAASDVSVHPTQVEGFGLVLVEAMACGIPVVTSNVQGIPEVLEGTNSIMVQPDDPKALCEAVLKTLHRKPGKKTQAIEKGLKRAEGFRMKRRVDNILELFERCLTRDF